MAWTRIMAATAASVVLVSIHCAAAEQDLAKQNADLQRRVETLEKQVQELTKTVPATHQPSTTVLPPPAPKDTDKKKLAWANLDIQFYGYVKADASYDTSRTYPGNYVLWAESEATNRNDDEFNLTANETRLGIMLKGPDDAHLQTSGRVEFDFYGKPADENRAKIQMRHAYLQWTWPDDRLGILAGQTSDVFSPLAPPTLNYTVLWDAGNIGYRRPQIRLTKSIPLDKGATLELQGAIARTIGRNSPTGSESGEDAGFPTVQGRASVTFPFIAGKPATAGFSGHWGSEEYDLIGGTHRDFQSWSCNVDVSTAVNNWLALKGELFAGENLETYLGGIGQGVNTTGMNEIGSSGGWFAASLGPWDKWRFNLGAGIDDVDASDLNVGDRVLNRCVFTNAIYSFDSHAEVGLELSHWRTDYLGLGDADALRAQISLIYRF